MLFNYFQIIVQNQIGRVSDCCRSFNISISFKVDLDLSERYVKVVTMFSLNIVQVEAFNKPAT